MSRSITALAPIIKEVTVVATPARAFELFTRHIARWWPLVTHSCGGADARGVTIEERIGGRITEITHAGLAHEWGTVTTWNPPFAFAMAWHPGKAPQSATHVLVTFAPITDDTCLVRLAHSGWDAEAAARRDTYVRGWSIVLDDFVQHVQREGQ
ncbi:MAG TPA: SRPBCC domain-containing protein [Casimicrobiaceae bacterium]|nr:SRPBCC domain-containing protein [Casimicrobiaceae bacterium]